jgi:serine/threonine protein kinase
VDLAFKEVLLGDCCHHKNVARILDIYVGDVPRLVFQWADGSMLLQMAVESQGCSGQAFSQVQKVMITRDTLSGIAHLHCRGIVHSTMRPSAVVVHFRSERVPSHAQILDLAGAAIVETVTEAAFGPMEYMAPEVLLGCPDASPPADVWSAALVMAFVFTGNSMFTQTLSDRSRALSNIFAVLGGLSPSEIQEFSLFPHWLPIHGVPDEGWPWEAQMVEGGGPGADLLLRRMLAFSVGRCFLFKRITTGIIPQKPSTTFPESPTHRLV